jgi:hypothetical protein
MLFHGIRDASEAATCLAGYDKTRYPEGSGPTFTGYFLAKSFAAGCALSTVVRISGTHSSERMHRLN